MKKWSPGVADEAWKIMICARDASRADETITGLVYILTDAGAETERGVTALRQMTGAEIMDGLVRYQSTAHASVRNGMART